MLRNSIKQLLRILKLIKNKMAVCPTFVRKNYKSHILTLNFIFIIGSKRLRFTYKFLVFFFVLFYSKFLNLLSYNVFFVFIRIFYLLTYILSFLR